MTRFRIGDIVTPKNKESLGRSLELGVKYKVLKLYKHYIYEYVHLQSLNKNEVIICSLSSSRIELVKDHPLLISEFLDE